MMEPLPLVLVVDDDPDVLMAASVALAKVARVDTASSPADAAKQQSKTVYDAVLLDMNFALGERGGKGGLDALADFRASDDALSVVLMTTYGGVVLAVESLQRGACDFILKPWRIEALLTSVTRAVDLTTASRRAKEFPTLDEVEADAIRRALAKSGGNVSEAAAGLGLTRQALYRRMVRHGL